MILKPAPGELTASLPDPVPGRTCVAFEASATHPGIEAQFLRLAEEGAGEADTFLLLDTASGSAVPERLRQRAFSYDSREFDRWGYATFGSPMLPGHTHFPFLRFFEAQPDYDHYWLVEYDVEFTGRWRSLFGACDRIDADFLACHVRTWRDEPDWFWWRSLRHPSLSLDRSELFRSLNAVSRYSRQALAKLCESHRAGWAGHQEGLTPTLLRRAGLKIADIGGTGSFVAAGFERRFYTSFSTRDGALQSIGTMRWRPAASKAGRRLDTLYHPVKPQDAFRRDPLWMEALRSGREYLRHALWRARRQLSK